MSVRILLADDHGLIIEGIHAALEKEPGLEVIGRVQDGLEALNVAREQQPDLVLMDISMPGMNGIEATRRITEELPAVKVLGMSMHSHKTFVVAALQAGASGYLLKERTVEDLVEAIRTVMANRTYLCPALTGTAVDAQRDARRPDNWAPSTLTSREREVLQLIAEGFTSPAIARRLHVSVKTVSTHRQNIMKKLRIRNVAGLTRFAIEHGVTSAGVPAASSNASERKG